MDFRFGFLFFSVAMTVVAFWYMTPCNMLLNSDIAEESAPLHCWWWRQHIATKCHESARPHCVTFSKKMCLLIVDLWICFGWHWKEPICNGKFKIMGNYFNYVHITMMGQKYCFEVNQIFPSIFSLVDINNVFSCTSISKSFSHFPIIWVAPKKFQMLLRRLAPLTFSIRVQAFRDPLRGELPHVQTVMNDGPNRLTWDAQLLSYWFSRNPARRSSKISSWIWSIISRVVTVLSLPGRGATQVEKSPRLHWAT